MHKLKLISVAAGLLLGTSAIAQNPPAPPQQPPQQQAQVDVSDTKLDKFVEIYVDVETTRSRLASQLSNIEDPEQAQKVQMQMRDEIISTIEDHGWSLDEYNQVAQAIASDQQLKEKALEKINDRTT